MISILLMVVIHAIIPIYEGDDIGELIDELETPLSNGKYIKLNWSNTSALLKARNQVSIVESLI